MKMKEEDKLIKKLKEAEKRIDSGEYLTEEEFFKSSHSAPKASVKEKED